MRLLVLGEGDNDLGKRTKDGAVPQLGALAVFVRRLLETADSKTPEIYVDQVRKQRRFPGRRGPSASTHGLDKKLVIASQTGIGRRVDAIVAVVDRDGSRNREPYAQLEAGKTVVESTGRACAIGQAIEMLEAWLLADEGALQKALNDRSIPTQPDPETLDAKDEQSERHPKGRLRRLIEGSRGGTGGSFTEAYAAIAERVDLDVVRRRCAKGFQPFADQVAGLA